MYTEARMRLAPRQMGDKIVKWCEVCRGLLSGQDVCVICRQRNSWIRKAFPEIVEACRYTKTTYKKMLKFKQPSTGVGGVDSEIHFQHGPIDCHTPHAHVIQHEGRYYAFLGYNKKILESGDTEQEAKRNMALLASSKSPKLSPNWRDYSWQPIEEHKCVSVIQELHLVALKSTMMIS